MKAQTAHVKLLNEGVDVWRPVQAISEGENIFTISPNTDIYNPKDEEQQFNPGQTVRVRQEQRSDGIIWVAYTLHSSS
jgi:hypothetical protein